MAHNLTILARAATGAGLLVWLTACSGGVDISGDRAAVKALRDAFAAHYADCAGKWTTVFPGGRHLQIVQPSFTIEDEQLSNAQKLNGVTYSGIVHPGKNSSTREYVAQGWNRYDATWTKWSNTYSLFTPRMQHVNGAWQFSSSLDFSGTAPDCGQVPMG